MFSEFTIDKKVGTDQNIDHSIIFQRQNSAADIMG